MVYELSFNVFATFISPVLAYEKLRPAGSTVRGISMSPGHFNSRRTGSSLTEYSLLLAVIACSTLFGARLIMSSGIWRVDTLNEHLNVASANSLAPAHAREIASTDAIENNRDAGQTTSRAVDYGMLFVLLGLGTVATVGLVKSRRKLQPADEGDIEEPLAPQARAERYALKRQEIYRVLCRNLKDLLTSNVNVGHIFSNMPVHVSPGSPIADLEQLMKEKQIRHVLVCDDDGKLLGVVSDRDVSSGKGSTASDIMTPHPCTISATADIRTAITMMLKNRFSSLPVINVDRLVGIITITDLIIMLQVTLQLLDKFNAELSNGTLLDPEDMAETLA
jgi:CBS domain-containing protein